ncbi:group 1 truncated hemoglobin [Tumebacillus algifaecis]|uniref:Group 1 truncated hemoglobin n=1 Tax=Tumebacillus algifaecis TaxID=1214604 RepID=A0A223D3Q4_9BACL|nr:group 1 truncated hemoglobin [Tumebacillus algifaecis]ASS76211.1 group 1 truncated hemoglobin [Tumebacillus algifaecis]
MSENTSLYAKLGGQEAIAAVVDNFYDRLLQDDTVNEFFKHTDMEKQRRHQAMFISFALGGPNQYTGKSMAHAHAGMNLQMSHFMAVANHLSAALRDFHVSEEDIQTVINHLLTLKDDILGK